MNEIPAEFRHLPRVDIYLENGDELMSLLIDLSKTSDAELSQILRNELTASQLFHECLHYDGFFINRKGNQVYIWPSLNGKKINLFTEPE